MIERTPFESICINELVKGCNLCVEGKKLVLFITGLCSRRCFYCSLSKKRGQTDNVWANERLCKSVRDAVLEAESSSAQGAGITGGDPLLVEKRTLKYIKALKKKFGKNFHIHIYLPTDNLKVDNIKRLYLAGVDEVRFHPYFLKKDLRSEIGKISLAGLFFMKHQIGCEIPALPHKKEEIMRFIEQVKNVIGFLNINELELSDTNADFLLRQGFNINKEGYTIKGSKDTALKILSYCEKNTKMRVHYCSARTKNLYQYKNRLKRRALKIKRCYDTLTSDFTLRRAAFYPPESKPGFCYRSTLNKLQKEKLKHIKKLEFFRNFLIGAGVPKKMLEIDKERLRLLTSRQFAFKYSKEAKDRGFVPAYVEELPVSDSTILELDFLN